MKTIYEANDGKQFDDKYACLEHEAEIRQCRENDILAAAKEIDATLWMEYFGEAGKEPGYRQEFIWLEEDILAIVLRSETKPTLEEVKGKILNAKYGEEIAQKLNFEQIQKEIKIRQDWLSALKGVKKGWTLSGDIGWGFYPDDIKQLAQLHKSNKCRRKIEELLEDCNFHTECSDFSSGSYDKYIS